MKVYMDDVNRFDIINHHNSRKIICNLFSGYPYLAIKIIEYQRIITLNKHIYLWFKKNLNWKKIDWANKTIWMIELVYKSVHVQF